MLVGLIPTARRDVWPSCPLPSRTRLSRVTSPSSVRWRATRRIGTSWQPVRANAELLVTFNLVDFPAESLAPYDLTVNHPDDFLLDQLDVYPGATVRALGDQAAAYSQPPITVEAVLAQLSRSGVPRFADEVRRHL